MGSLVFFVYLMGVMGALKGALFFCFFVSLGAVVFGGIKFLVALGGEDEEEEVINKSKTIMKRFGKICIALLLISIFIPSQTTMAVIVGDKITNIAIETPEFNKIREVINIKLDAIIEGNKND